MYILFLLYYIIYCYILYYIVLYYLLLYIILYYILLYYIISYYTILYYILLYYIIFYYIILFILYYIILYYIYKILFILYIIIYEATPEWQLPPQLVLNTPLLLHLMGGWPADFIEVRAFRFHIHAELAGSLWMLGVVDHPACLARWTTIESG